ncbi:MAG: tetratricopeptide repeat protein [Bacteroidota bacterium]|nr:tetratricopeptide repeat protein [Bacteroidota bacterium]
MFSRTVFFLVFYLIAKISFAQSLSIEEAKSYFEQEKYSLAQSIFDNIYLDEYSEEALFYSASCSKILFTSDAEYKFRKFLDEFSYSPFRAKVYIALAEINYREGDFNEAVNWYLKSNTEELKEHDKFRLAYSYFLIDSLDEASYHFFKLFNSGTKFSSVAKYYFAHIAYKQKFYETSLKIFFELTDDERFGTIAPYYIAQIYFLQKQYKDLIEYAKIALNDVISSRQSEIARMLADAYYQSDDFSNATLYFEKYFSYIDQYQPIDYFQVGHAYYNIADYFNAIKYLERVDNISDSMQQFSAYHLAGSYINLDKKNYALNAFKKASDFDYNIKIQEDAFYNYVKLAVEIDRSFDNTLLILEKYLTLYKSSDKRQEIESLMVKVLQKTTQYDAAYNTLKNLSSLSKSQKSKLQELSFFLGVNAYNKGSFKEALLLFQESQEYPFNMNILFMSVFWEADSYYQLSDYLESARLYNQLTVQPSKSLDHYIQLSKYNQAYCLFQLGNYLESNSKFRIYLENAKDSMRLQDAYLRIADGYFMQNEFLLAEQYYRDAASYGLFDTDYSLYYQSICLGLLNRNLDKIKILERIIKDFRASTYLDNALLDIAEYYKNQNNYEFALSYYDTLLLYTKDIQIASRAYLSKGMIHFNNNNLDTAIVDLKYILSNFKETSSFKEALSVLRSIYSNKGNIEEFVDIIKGMPNVNITKYEQDSLTYHAGFMRFSNQDFQQASSIFIKYLSNFPEGIFLNEANFYLAESSVEIKDTSMAIKHYSYIVENHCQIYLENALTFLARYSYRENNYSDANTYYIALSKASSTNNLTRESLIRLMYINEQSAPDEAYRYALDVVAMDKIDNWLLSRANIIIGRKQFNEGNYAKARNTFQQVQLISNDDDGAEALFFLIYLHYLDEDYSTVEQMVFSFAENYYNEYFIAKAFLLLANIYEYQDNKFQAKATLESIIQNYPEDDLVNQARKKHEQLVTQEQKEEERINAERQSYIDILEDEIDYQLLYEEEASEIDGQDTIIQQDIINQDTIYFKDGNIKEEPSNNDTIYFKDE